MKREEAIELATKMLLKIFNDDTEAVKTIILSKTAFSENGDKEGAAVICSALIDMKQLIQELIDAIIDD